MFSALLEDALRLKSSVEVSALNAMAAAAERLQLWLTAAERREEAMIKVRDHPSSHSLTQQKAALVCACQLMLYYAFVRISLHGRLCASKTCYLLVSAGWFLDWMTGDWPDDKKSDQLSDCFTRSTTDWQLDCLVFSLVWRLMYCLY